MKKILIWVGALLVTAVAFMGIWFFLFINPRHYDAADFLALEVAPSIAADLRSSGKRGMLEEENWPYIFIEYGAKEIRVYPTGVLVKLHGVFTLESGLYFPASDVARNIDAREDATYQKMADGIYSYKIAE